MEPGKTFQNLSPEKQARIARIAVEEFSQKGFDGASINGMVRRMNIAKGSIFQYFGDKKGLFRFVFHQSLALVKDYLRDLRDASSDQPLPWRLRHILRAGIRFVRQHPLLFRLYTRVIFDPKVPFRDEILETLRGQSVNYLKSLLESAKSKGELREGVNPAAAAFVLDAVMERFLLAHAVRHLDSGLGIHDAPEETIKAWIADIIDILCAGVGHEARSGHMLIIGAVEEELKGLGRQLEHPAASRIGRRGILSGEIQGRPVQLLVSGPGMVNTAQALSAAVEYQRPALILQTGCAGGFRQAGVQIGDVALATVVIDAQIGLESSDGLADELPFTLLEARGQTFRNRFSVNHTLAAKAWEILNRFAKEWEFQLHQGPFLTVSTVTTTDRRAEALFSRYHACMEEMEGAAAAQVAALYGIPYLAVRSAANIAGKRDREAWSLPLAVENSNKVVLKLIQSLDYQSVNHCIQK